MGDEEVGGEDARREEEGDTISLFGGVEGAAVVGGEVGGHVVDLEQLRLDKDAADLGLEGVGGGEDEEATAAANTGGVGRRLVVEMEEEGGDE